MPVLPEIPNNESGPPSNKKGPPAGRPPLWRFPWWYLLVVLVVLMLWQDRYLAGVSVQTIPYSEFKEYLARGEVNQCEIHETEIQGEITPRVYSAENPAAKTNGEKGATEEKKAGSEAKKPDGAPKKPDGEAKKADAEEKKAADDTSGKTPAAISAAPKEKDKEKPTAGNRDGKPFMFRAVREPDADRDLIQQLQAAGVKYEFSRPNFLSQVLIAWILPLGIMVALWFFLSRGLRNAGQAVMGFGRSKARVIADKDTGVTFDDVAGCDEAKYELQEVVDFLKNPDRYTALGAKIPKGVLLVGPPGTGKTLLSRAVAGEAGVPFFSLSGSEFVEMFVGVGAARVRDLFEQAKAQAPCIIFIDELDAIGRERSVHMAQVNDEREQTLNQLLVEMDGFQANVGVIILAATNRPEVLDRALLRPGRFDRQVVIDAPDLDGRLAILKVHSRNKPLALDTDLRRVAQGTPGFSGADLANALNEAALIAARRKATEIAQPDLEEAVEKVVAGPERKSRRLVEEEKRRVAFHETGHALVATYSEHADQVHKISIVPRGRAALGYTLQLPDGEQFLMTRSELLDRIKGMLGGRAAEEVVFSEVSTGAENDLERATAIARQMVAVYGMSEKIGLIHCARRPEFMPFGQDGGRLDCSPEMADQIDREVRQMLDTAYNGAKAILLEHRDQLDLVAKTLIERESLDKGQFLQLIGRPLPEEEKIDNRTQPIPRLPQLAPFEKQDDTL